MSEFEDELQYKLREVHVSLQGRLLELIKDIEWYRKELAATRNYEKGACAGELSAMRSEVRFIEGLLKKL